MKILKAKTFMSLSANFEGATIPTFYFIPRNKENWGRALNDLRANTEWKGSAISSLYSWIPSFKCVMIKHMYEGHQVPILTGPLCYEWLDGLAIYVQQYLDFVQRMIECF